MKNDQKLNKNLMLVFFVCLSTGFDLGYSLTVYCFGPMFIAIGPTKKNFHKRAEINSFIE